MIHIAEFTANQLVPIKDRIEDKNNRKSGTRQT